jgi:hypothetical protein
MMRNARLGHVFRRHPVLTIAFVLALIATVIFGARALMFAITLDFRAEQPVAGWMTPRYVLRTYGLDPAELEALLDLDSRDEARLPLDAIARAKGEDLADLLARLQAALDARDAAP